MKKKVFLHSFLYQEKTKHYAPLAQV